MKKKFLVAVMVVVMIMMTILLVGCVDPNNGNNDSNENNNKLEVISMSLGFMQNVDAEGEFISVNIKNYNDKKLKDLLEGDKTLGAKIENGMLVSIKGLEADNDKHLFISVYTSQEEYKSDYGDLIEKGGTTYYPANVGINDLPVNKECKYLFVLMSW